MVNLYVDLETINLLKKIRDEDPDFNLAGFVKHSLLNKEGISKSLPESEILKNIQESEISIKQAENKLEYWNNIYKEFKINEGIKAEKLRLEELEKENKRKKEKEKEANQRKVFFEELGRPMTDFEFDQFIQGGRNIFYFCDQLKEREKKN